jgi:hypothetical protein
VAFAVPIEDFVGFLGGLLDEAAGSVQHRRVFRKEIEEAAFEGEPRGFDDLDLMREAESVESVAKSGEVGDTSLMAVWQGGAAGEGEEVEREFRDGFMLAGSGRSFDGENFGFCVREAVESDLKFGFGDSEGGKGFICEEEVVLVAGGGVFGREEELEEVVGGQSALGEK